MALFFVTRYIKILWRFHIYENFFVSTEFVEDITILKSCRWVRIWEYQISFLRFGSAMIFWSRMGYHPILDARFALFSPSSFRKSYAVFLVFFVHNEQKFVSFLVYTEVKKNLFLWPRTFNSCLLIITN